MPLTNDKPDQNASRATLDSMKTQAGELVRVRVGHPREETVSVRRVYYLLLALNVMVNFDAGAIPAVIDVIQEELGISKTGMGLIGSMPYWGLFIASPVLGFMLKAFSQKEVLGLLLLINAGMVTVFAFSTTMSQMMVARLLIGISQGGFVIYSPCWVDEMAPVTSKTLWMALLQAVVPLGVVFGYLVAGVMSASGVHWSWSLIIQATTIMILAVVFIALPYKYTDDFWLSPRLKELREEFKTAMGIGNNRKPRSNRDRFPTGNIMNADAMTKRKSEKAGSFGKTIKLLRNPMFTSLTLTLSVLWFIVTGVQYWATEFFVTVFQVDKGLVVACFAVVALTGPTIGVIAGGIVCDMRGGYEGKVGRRKTLIQCQFCTFIAVAMGILCGVVPGQPGAAYWICIFFLWLLLLFGGSVVPCATGLMIACVSPDEKQLASGIGQGAYNLLGYALGTLLPGVLMEMFGMHWGMRVLLGWGVLGLVGVTFTIAANARMSSRERGSSSATSTTSGDTRERTGTTDSTYTTVTCGNAKAAEGTTGGDADDWTKLSSDGPPKLDSDSADDWTKLAQPGGPSLEGEKSNDWTIPQGDQAPTIEDFDKSKLVAVPAISNPHKMSL